MTFFKALAAIVVLLITSSSVSAAILRTAPFPGYLLLTGGAHCAVVNGGSTNGSATVVLYDHVGTALAQNIFTLGPNRTGIGTEAFPPYSNPTFCECTVPNTTNWRCSFIYLDSTVTAPTVIDGR